MAWTNIRYHPNASIHLTKISLAYARNNVYPYDALIHASKRTAKRVYEQKYGNVDFNVTHIVDKNDNLFSIDNLDEMEALEHYHNSRNSNNRLEVLTENDVKALLKK